MKAMRIAGYVARRAITAALLLLSWAGPARAQVGIGVAYPGVPFMYYTPQYAPSPTDYLYDRDRERISAHGNAVQQQAAASSMASAGSDSNAYFNRIRDYSGEETYHVRSRQSLSRRTSPPPERAASRPGGLSLDAYFLVGGQLDWPRDAPDTAALHPARVDAETALKAVRDEVRSSGKAKAQSVGTAKYKLVNYGQRALTEIKSSRSEAVGVVFHYFLLFLHQSLDQAAGTGTS
jgi:hypothetical protein